MKTKIFCDSADYNTIKFFNNKNLVDGFTTNPSLMRLSGAKNYKFLIISSVIFFASANNIRVLSL